MAYCKFPLFCLTALAFFQILGCRFLIVTVAEFMIYTEYPTSIKWFSLFST